MTVLEALKKVTEEYNKGNIKNDCVDFYIDGWDQYFPTFVIPDDELKFTEYALKKFEEVFNYEVHSIDYPDLEKKLDWTVITIKEPEGSEEEDFEKVASKLNNFLLIDAGYGPWVEYKKIFGEEEYANGPIFDEYDIYLKYEILLDTDLFGQFYDTWKELYDKNVSKEEFEKKYNELTNNEE